jgi:hypothetical protein
MLIVLMYAVSFYIWSSFKLNIHNQCSNIDLVSPTYITHGRLDWHKSPNYKVCAGDTIRSGFIIKSYDVSCGALIYGIQRKRTHESTEISEDTSSVVHLLVVWRFFESNKLYADVLLVVHDKGFDWNRDNLEEFYNKNSNRFRLCSDSATETWLLDDNVTLMTTFGIMNNDRVLEITISEVERDNNTRMPVRIDMEK